MDPGQVSNGEIRVDKIGGKTNLADALTKFVDAKALAVHVEGLEYTSWKTPRSTTIG